MGNLREQLLKAKLIDETQSREARQSKRKKRKEAGAKALANEAQEKQIAYQKKIETEARNQKQLAMKNIEKKSADTRETRIRQMIEASRITTGLKGSLKFYFVSRSGVIPCMEISSSVAESLCKGRLAIVEKPENNRVTFEVIPREIVRQLKQIAPELVLFFNE